MPSPFPGMDPYVEHAARWRDFHATTIVAIKATLLPLVRPKYVPVTEERLFVVESDRPIYPDVTLLASKHRPGKGKRSPSSPVAVMAPDEHAIFDMGEEEVRQPFVTIVDPTNRNRVITAIELLSPDNKRPGPGRDSYLEKRGEYWNSGASLVEIDLLRAGDPTVYIAPARLERLRPWHYLVTVTRAESRKHEVYAIPLDRPLPRIGIPLKRADQDAILDLQAVFARAWDECAYPELLQYHKPPPGTLTPEEVKWCVKQLRDSGMRNGR